MLCGIDDGGVGVDKQLDGGCMQTEQEQEHATTERATIIQHGYGTKLARRLGVGIGVWLFLVLVLALAFGFWLWGGGGFGFGFVEIMFYLCVGIVGIWMASASTAEGMDGGGSQVRWFGGKGVPMLL